MQSVAPPRIWTRFIAMSSLPSGLPSALPEGARVTHYRVDAVERVRGSDEAPFVAGEALVRVESEASLLAHEAGLAGVTGHVLYTDQEARAALGRISAKESGPMAVLIPIRKSAAWWAMAQDERTRMFRGAERAVGHHAVGVEYASRIFRRLYHARWLPGSRWDFLTYFEFPLEERPAFAELLQKLRDPRVNPEWEFVEAEVECWMRRVEG